MPTAAPPGAMYVDAVEAWVETNARQKPSPGSVAIHGGANVARLISVTIPSSASDRASRVLTSCQTSP